MGSLQIAAGKALVALGLIGRPDYFALKVKEHPNDAEVLSGYLYIVANAGSPKWAYFQCPDAKQEIIQLSLMKSRRPNWVVKIDWIGRPTISPSVRQTSGSFAHFWLRKGHVVRCDDHGSERPPKR